MKYILLLIVYFLSFQGFSQFNVRNYSKDYNLDGVLDTLYSHYDGGSSFGGTYVKITNGKTKEILEYDSFGPYAMITHVVSIQPNFILKKNKSFLNILKKIIYLQKEKNPILL